jgi:hypothetical protein
MEEMIRLREIIEDPNSLSREAVLYKRRPENPCLCSKLLTTNE